MAVCIYQRFGGARPLPSRSDELKVAVRLQPTEKDSQRAVASRQRRMTAQKQESCSGRQPCLIARLAGKTVDSSAGNLQNAADKRSWGKSRRDRLSAAF